MDRAELRQIAKGLKAARPSQVPVGNFTVGENITLAENIVPINMNLGAGSSAVILTPYGIWISCVQSVARELELKDQALSNFYAAAGYLHAS